MFIFQRLTRAELIDLGVKKLLLPLNYALSEVDKFCLLIAVHVPLSHVT